jgi:SAM-dependent methyltransferase
MAGESIDGSGSRRSAWEDRQRELPTCQADGDIVEKRRELGLIFDEDARLYDRVRPRYPPELFDDLAQIVPLSPEARILEIGAGTGQATLDLARRGYTVLALEPGKALAHEARRKLRDFPRTTVCVVSFEGWIPGFERFDAVVAATSFHWLDPAVRVEKGADALRADGALAIISTHHVAGGTSEFFDVVQECYVRHDPTTEPGLVLPREAQVSIDVTEIERSGRFDRIDRRAYAKEETYSAEGYEEVLMTYSGHRALEPRARSALLACIRDLINHRFGGRITKRYLFTLTVAHRRADRS